MRSHHKNKLTVHPCVFICDTKKLNSDWSDFINRFFQKKILSPRNDFAMWTIICHCVHFLLPGGYATAAIVALESLKIVIWRLIACTITPTQFISKKRHFCAGVIAIYLVIEILILRFLSYVVQKNIKIGYIKGLWCLDTLSFFSFTLDKFISCCCQLVCLLST